MNRNASLMALCLFLWIAAGPVRAQPGEIGPLATILPAETEMLLALNTGPLMESGWLDTFIDRRNMRRSLEAHARLLEQLTGTDPMSDLERVYVFGRVGDDVNTGLVVRGRFEREKLLTLVQINPQYEELELGELAVHRWFDKKEERIQYGAFLDDETIVLWNSEAVFEASRAAINDPGARLAPGVLTSLMPEGAGEAAAWAVLITRQPDCPGALLRVRTASARIDLDDAAARIWMNITPETLEAGRQWRSMLEGAVAFARLQREHPGLAEMVRDVRIDESGEGGVTCEASLGRDQAFWLLEQLD